MIVSFAPPEGYDVSTIAACRLTRKRLIEERLGIDEEIADMPKGYDRRRALSVRSQGLMWWIGQARDAEKTLHQARQPERDRSEARFFVTAARQMLDEETYLAIWKRAEEITTAYRSRVASTVGAAIAPIGSIAPARERRLK